MKKLYVLLSLCLFLAGRTFAQPCSGSPSANTVVATSTLLCAGGTVTLGLQYPYTTTGMTYQWLYSGTSPVGPWTPLFAATFSTYVTNNINTGYYTVIIGCSNSQASVAATAVFLQAGSTTITATVPYYEDFEQQSSNTLPNCAWQATNLGTNSLVWFGASNSGVAMAGFSYSPSALGTNTFYSMGLQLSANVMYSVALFQRTSSLANSNNWSSFGVGIGPQQSSSNATIVTSTAPPNAGAYALRSGTFTVPSNGIYYVQVFGTSVSGTAVAQQLYFDDLSVTIPCTTGSSNMPYASYSPASTTVCANDSIQVIFIPTPGTTLSIPSNTVYYKPATSTLITVPITNTLTGCVATVTLPIIVQPAPGVFAVAMPSDICPGQSAVIQAGLGSAQHTLNPGNLVGTIFTVSPASTTVYTISLVNTFNTCRSSSTINITVKPNPTVTTVPSSATVCAQDSMVIQAFGAFSYSLGQVATGSQIGIPRSSASQTYVITGQSVNGCRSTATYVQKVDACTGLAEESLSALEIFPVPATEFICIRNAAACHVSLISETGQVVLHQYLVNGEGRLTVGGLTEGIYLLQVRHETVVSNRKIIVQSR